MNHGRCLASGKWALLDRKPGGSSLWLDPGPKPCGRVGEHVAREIA